MFLPSQEGRTTAAFLTQQLSPLVIQVKAVFRREIREDHGAWSGQATPLITVVIISPVGFA